MAREIVESEIVGKKKIRRSTDDQHKIEGMISFSVAVLLVLLYKFSARLQDHIRMRIKIDRQEETLDFHYSISDTSTFYFILLEVKNYIESSPLFTHRNHNLEISWLTDEPEADYNIQLTRVENQNLPAVDFSCKPGAFFESAFKQAAHYYQNIASHVLENPLNWVRDIHYLSKKDLRSLEVFAYGPVDEQISKPEYIDHLFDQTVEKHPHSTAVVDGKKNITYEELQTKANHLANFLCRKGVRPGEPVAVLLTRSVEAYISILGILKCGAAYVPIDIDYPAERIKHILNDSAARFLISHSSYRESYGDFQGSMLKVDTDFPIVLAGEKSAPLMRMERTAESPAYIIYTSGSTGKPKGVVISHTAASNLIKAERYKFGVKSTDRVAQGFSLAFDASVEEIWLAFSTGAALHPVDKETMCSGVDICEFINRHKISVFSTVPTLLSIMPLNLPSLHLLILGGEPCPHNLLLRWKSNSLRIVNTYGPTEATVIATAADFHPDEKITIGKPIANYGVFITDDSMNLVPPGVPGELCIAGHGLAIGYHNNPELTEQKFVEPAFAIGNHFPKRIYRSGDLARFTEQGELEFLGRIDTQVKLRGYRIELSEIEAQLLQIENIKSASVILKEDTLRGASLVAFIVLQSKEQVMNEVFIKDMLRKRLASFMVPSVFVEVDELPLLPSGKVDKKKLAGVPLPEAKDEKEPNESLNEIEKRIQKVWAKYFSPKKVSKKDNFFLELGGHSLLAAKTVSELRLHKTFARLSVQDVYKYPTIEKLARYLSLQHVSANSFGTGNHAHYYVSRIKHFFCGVFQFFSFYFIWGYNLIRDFSLYAIFFYLYRSGHSFAFAATAGLVSAVLSYPVLIMLAIATKWTLLGRIKAGRHRLWGNFYIRWWFVRKIFQLLDLHQLAGTPLLPMVYRALGMKIGRDVHLETDLFAAYDVIKIGEGTSIEEEVCANGFSVKDGYLIIGSITIGKNCFVGTRSMLCENTVMEDEARIEDLSLIPAGGVIPSGETWAGSPAQFVSELNPASVMQRPERNARQRWATNLLYVALVCIIPVISFVAFIPGVVALLQFDPFAEPLKYIMVLPFIGVSFVVLLTMQVVALKWILVGRVKPGIYPVHGNFYIRNWIVDQLLRISLDHVGQLHATLYVNSWYRALGMRIGRFVELSTACSSTPDLIQLSEGCTIADEVSLGSPHIERGWITVAHVRLGYRTFAGNSAVIPAGIRVGRNSLIGVLSITPKREEAEQANATWFGSPAILFPKREANAEYKEEKTYKPSNKLRMARGAFELLRVTLPPAALIIVAATVINVGLVMWDRVGLAGAMLLLPIVLGLSSVFMVLMVVVIKWLIMGRYKPFAKPLWSNFVWRLEFVNALYEFFAAPLLLELLQGTPFLPWYLKMMGVKVGRKCYIDTTGFLEWDLVELGNRVVVNENAIIQTHLFEDRVLKASHVKISSDCTIGAGSVVLYNSLMRMESKLDALTLLMKGESLPQNTHWVGIPAAHKIENTHANGNEVLVEAKEEIG